MRHTHLTPHVNPLPLDPTCKARTKKFSISKIIKNKNTKTKKKKTKTKTLKKRKEKEKKRKLFPQQVAFALSGHPNPDLISYLILPFQKTTLSIIPYYFTIHPTSQTSTILPSY